MKGYFIFNICMLLMSGAESCFLSSSIHVSVPQSIPAHFLISKVDLHDHHCEIFTSSDPAFTLRSDGAVVTTTTVPNKGQTFSVWAQDPSGNKGQMVIHLVHRNILKREASLKRSKRRWGVPPFEIYENDGGPFPKQIDRIGSTAQQAHKVYYTISGPGVTEHPVGLFSVEKFSGMLSVHRAVDREEYSMYEFTAHVYDKETHQERDEPLKLTVVVFDKNDNKPTFTGPLQFTVPEQSKADTPVGKVNATDRDEEKTINVKIRYSILSGRDLFAIDPVTGVISTLTNQLDREVQDKHFATVEIKDMDGDSRGLSNTATATITLRDINDNPPTFTKTSYDVNIKENQNPGLILRIPVEDKDLINTPNWNSQFVITKGNQDGIFRIERDPKTNEGLLYTTKPVDYEKAKNLKLEIMARNEAELSGATASWASIPVDVSVTDVDEGPQFSAPTVRFIVQENTANGTLIGTYTAVDPETESSAGIKYYKVTDPASWINVDANSGQLKVANTIDRESHFVQDGIYNITMKAVDSSSKTGTGTVIIQVEDANDHVPELPTTELLVCEKAGALGSVPVVAVDKDQSPFAGPFSFDLAEGHDDKWTVNKLNDTAATLQQTIELPTGRYSVPVTVKDLQGSGRTQMATVRICQCWKGACLDKERSTAFGVWGVLAMLLGLALLLLFCICCASFCVTKPQAKDFEDLGDSGGVLLKSNTEAPGDAVDTKLIIPTVTLIEEPVKGSLLDAQWVGNKSSSTVGGLSVKGNQTSGLLMTDRGNEYTSSQQDMGQFGTGQFGTGQFGTGQFGTGQFGTGQFGTGQFGTGQFGSGQQWSSQFANTNVAFGNGHLFDNATAHHTWQTNGRFVEQKLAYLGTEEEGRFADDILHSYGFEGVGSPAGSVGCCSDQGNSDDLSFLDTLGPKFKTLAEVCTKK